MVYIWDQMTQTPSLTNPLLRTILPGTPPHFTALLHGILPVSWNNTSTFRAMATSTAPCISATFTITVITAPLRHNPDHRHIRYLTLAQSSASEFPCGHPFPTGFDSLVFRFDYTQLFFYSIWLTSNIFIFNPSNKIRITFQSGLGESHIGQGISEIFQHWNIGVFQILIIEIIFGENTLTK